MASVSASASPDIEPSTAQVSAFHAPSVEPLCNTGASSSLPLSLSRSPEEQQWDRFFKPRAAFERARGHLGCSSASSPALPNSPLSSPNASVSSPGMRPVAAEAPDCVEDSPAHSDAELTATCLRQPPDPRAIQESNRALVSHEFLIERSSDLQFETKVTSVTKCSPIVC